MACRMKQWQLRSALSHLRDLDGLGGDLGVDDRDRLTEVSDLVEGTAATEVTLLDPGQLASERHQGGRLRRSTAESLVLTGAGQ